MADASSPILTVENLRVAFGTPSGPVEAVRGVSFSVGREKLGIIGESGSGKSMTGRAVMRLLPPAARMSADQMRFEEVDLLAASERAMRTVRGRRVAMILQDPKYSLNPVMTVGEQIVEMARLHLRLSAREARERTLDMLAQVQIRDPARVFTLYPHEVSGGMGQRIMISMMLIASPSLVIADEPTSALDVSVRRDILRLLDELVRENGSGLVLISHDIRMVAAFCDRILVMYKGRVVEELANLDDAAHPYTRGLLEALPDPASPTRHLKVMDRRRIDALEGAAR